MDELSESLHTTITLTTNQAMIKMVPLFADVDPNYVLAIVKRLTTSVVLPGDFIVHAGTVGKQMYFISKVCVCVCGSLTTCVTLSFPLFAHSQALTTCSLTHQSFTLRDTNETPPPVLSLYFMGGGGAR